METNEGISVIIPFKNRANTILRAIKSVENQKINFPIEIILVDDFSSDESLRIIKNYSIKIPYKIITNKVSLGGAVSRNIGANNSNYNYLAFLDSDDEWIHDHLISSLSFIKKNNIDGCFSSFNLISNSNKYLRKLPSYNNGNFLNYIFISNGDSRTSTIVLKKEIFLKTLFHQNAQKHQDWDLMLRISNRFNIKSKNDPSVNIYIDEENRMSNYYNVYESEKFILRNRSHFSGLTLNLFRLNMMLKMVKCNCSKKDLISQFSKIKFSFKSFNLKAIILIIYICLNFFLRK